MRTSCSLRLGRSAGAGWLAAALVTLGACRGSERDEPRLASSGSAAPSSSSAPAGSAATPTGRSSSGASAPSGSAAAPSAASPERSCDELFAPWGDHQRWPGTLAEQNELLFKQLECVHGLGGAELARLRALFAASEWIGQGNPAVSEHPVTAEQCLAATKGRGDDLRLPEFERICGAKYMAPLYDPESGQKPTDAKVCIDRFEFPNIPCAYPVTWVRANEVVEICGLEGKRICDAHEWEGACDGRLLGPDYELDTIKYWETKEAANHQRGMHNSRIVKAGAKRWAYGKEYRTGVCGTASHKSQSCGSGWSSCGTNTFPAGFFPDCQSPLGVYDQHGNAAEHMNLPLKESELATSPTHEYGFTEMKGSWFVFDQIRAHDDWCRWRAPFWHGTRITNPQSHRNYHLGFRCCKDVKPD